MSRAPLRDRLPSPEHVRDREGMFKGIMQALDRLEAETELTAAEQRRLRHGRWRHEFRPKETLAYRFQGLYYRFRAMLTVPLRSYF
jgi:hypothetical protein